MTHSQYVAVFEDLATKHSQIAHQVGGRNAFARMIRTGWPDIRLEYTQLLHGIRGSLTYPALVVESAEVQYQDNQGDQRTRAHNGAFLILQSASVQNDGDADVDAKLSQCEAIGEQILAALFKMWQGDPRIRIPEVGRENILFPAEGLVGTRFDFTYYTYASGALYHQPDNWTIDPLA